MLYFISDIHGNYDLLVALLECICFNEDDTLLCLGDMIEKGPDSIKVLKLFMMNQNMIPLMGNHEMEVLKLYDKYNDIDALNNALPESNNGYTMEMIKYMQSLPFYYEGEDFIACHAGVALDENKRIIPMNEQKKSVLIYDRKTNDPNFIIKDSKTLIFGHTPTSFVCEKEVKYPFKIIKYPREANVNEKSIKNYYKIHIDTGVYIHHALGTLCYDTMEEYYVINKNV